jgi:hypothetical protein
MIQEPGNQDCKHDTPSILPIKSMVLLGQRTDKRTRRKMYCLVLQVEWFRMRSWDEGRRGRKA